MHFVRRFGRLSGSLLELVDELDNKGDSGMIREIERSVLFYT